MLLGPSNQAPPRIVTVCKQSTVYFTSNHTDGGGGDEDGDGDEREEQQHTVKLNCRIKIELRLFPESKLSLILKTPIPHCRHFELCFKLRS